MNKSITIITVAFNNVSGLVKTSLSIEMQNGFDDYKWVVVDGGSADGTQDFLAEKKAFFAERLIYISEPDLGLYDAMNKGLGIAGRRGYIVFMNAGDEFYSPETLREVSINMDNQDADLFAGVSCRHVDNKFFYKPAKSIKHLKYGMFAEHQALFFRSEIAKSIKYDLRYSLSSDYDYVIRFILQDGVMVRKLGFPVCKFEHGGVSYVKRDEAILEDALIRIRNDQASFIFSMVIVVAQYVNHWLKCFFGRIN